MRLLPYSDVDRALTLALESDPAVMGHLGGVAGAGDAERVHQHRLAAVAGGDLFYTIVPEGESDPVGIMAIWRTDWESVPIYELGVMLVPRFQGRGVAVQAFDLILQRARAEGITRLDSFPAKTNRASNILLGHQGFSWVGDCDLDYEGRPLRCAHWVRDLTEPAA
jgi:RimJ/RimL family protein N-acetyltransferase